jgi:lipoprotein-releasing system ATP-binding protein
MRKPSLMPLIRLHNVTKTFPLEDGSGGELRVLKGISMDVNQGEIIAIVGASGAGKSTLLHIMGTLESPTAGEVIIEGKNVFSLGEEELARFRNRTIGFVFQFHHLLPEFTVLENVAMPALIQGMTLPQVKAVAEDLLREVGLEDRIEQKPPKLSGGEQQRAAVARALMNSPRVILADEPSGNLDSENARILHELMRDLSRSRGQTFVVVTHNEALAKKADRIVQIADGVVRT